MLPHKGGKIPETAFHTDRLALNRLQKEGIAIPDGVALEQRNPKVNSDQFDTRRRNCSGQWYSFYRFRSIHMRWVIFGRCWKSIMLRIIVIRPAKDNIYHMAIQLAPPRPPIPYQNIPTMFSLCTQRRCHPSTNQFSGNSRCPIHCCTIHIWHLKHDPNTIQNFVANSVSVKNPRKKKFELKKIVFTISNVCSFVTTSVDDVHTTIPRQLTVESEIDGELCTETSVGTLEIFQRWIFRSTSESLAFNSAHSSHNVSHEIFAFLFYSIWRILPQCSIRWTIWLCVDANRLLHKTVTTTRDNIVILCPFDCE